ncbi:MAG: hypothetical protein M1823_003375 [Watsoniomyces obsoletus]|nr:MAG: hypothetical protein M1823_003375 [Watsoniomyces obsoletus]
MASPERDSSSMSPVMQQSFLSRAAHPSTAPLAVSIYRLMDMKKSNLCLSADVSTTDELLDLAERVGDSICMIKTHADIIDDFGERTIRGLTELGRRKKFLIFEDRKFGDIGSTVQKQYRAGPLRIAQWASIVNAHIFPGPAIITALKSAATDAELLLLPPMREAGDAASSQAPDAHLPHRGLLLLAEMSSEGSLLTGKYTEECVALAREHRDFVIGFIAQRSLNGEPDDNFLTLTPGVSLPPAAGGSSEASRTGDGLGQQYNHPRWVVLEQGSDIIIVGRGILKASDPRAEAERYRQEAWKAYEDRLAREKN